MATLENTKEGYALHAVYGKFESTTLPQLGCIWASNLAKMKKSLLDRFLQGTGKCSWFVQPNAIPLHPPPQKSCPGFSTPVNIAP